MVSPYTPTGYRMIRSIDIRHFRCYRTLALNVPSRLNVIVGDNGVGKTALLEAIFFALANGSELAVRYRQVRGFDGVFSGTARRIEDAIWGDYFTDRDTSKPVSIALNGDGPENRSLVIARGGSDALILYDASGSSDIANGSISLTWTDSEGLPHSIYPKASAKGIDLPSTNEDLPDFFNLGAGVAVGAGEIASRFSDISVAGRRQEFVEEFCKEFSMIKDLNIEITGGSPVIFATLKNNRRVPLPSLSFGINKMIGVLGCIASRPRSVLTIDEVEIGIHYSHLRGVWSSILHFMRRYDSQIFVSTHSAECLSALIEAAADKIDDISIWRIERDEKDEPVIRQFNGSDVKLALDYDEEVR